MSDVRAGPNCLRAAVHVKQVARSPLVRADHGVYKTAQDEVCIWRDQSGNGNDLRPYTTARPIWQSAAVGGQSAIHASAAGQVLYTGNVLGIPATSGRTFVAVSQLVTANGRFNPIIQGQIGSSSVHLA